MSERKKPSKCDQCRVAKVEAKIQLDGSIYFFCKPCALELQSLPPKYRKPPPLFNEDGTAMTTTTTTTTTAPDKPPKSGAAAVTPVKPPKPSTASSSNVSTIRADGSVAATGGADRRDLPSARALYDWKATKSSEISFLAGEVIYEVRKMDGEWWRGCCKTGERGYFPKAYVELLAAGGGGGGGGGGAKDARRRAGNDADDQLFTTENPPLGRALFTFKAVNDHELPLTAGDVVGELEQLSGEWWRGSLRGARGFFPADYVMPLERGTLPKCPYDAVAKFDYWGKDGNQLTFRAGEHVLILEHAGLGGDGRPSGWWAGRARERVGYFPAKYARPMTEEEKAAGGVKGAAVAAAVAVAGSSNQPSPATSLVDTMQSLTVEEKTTSTSTPTTTTTTTDSDSDDSSDDGRVSYRRMVKMQFKKELAEISLPTEAPSAPPSSHYQAAPVDPHH